LVFLWTLTDRNDFQEILIGCREFLAFLAAGVIVSPLAFKILLVLGESINFSKMIAFWLVFLAAFLVPSFTPF